MAIIVLDTDVASGLIKDNLPPSLRGKLTGHQLVTTFINAGELERWSIQRGLGPRRRAEVDRWVSGPLLTGGRDVARKWAEIVAAADRRGRPRPVNNSWVAACCLAYALPLATLNRADFQDFVEHEGLTVISA